MIILLTMLVMFITYGVFISRWHGGGFISNTPKVLKNFLWALPFATVAYIAVPIYWVFAVVLGFCIIGKGTGHGGGMDLGTNPKEPGGNPYPRDPEKLEYLILWLHGKMPQYWYDALLLAIVGLAAVAACAVAVGTVNIWAGLLIALGGLAKALAYMIGRKVYPKRPINSDAFDEATEIGEGLTGGFAYAALAGAVYLTVSIVIACIE